ncbi:MAG: cytochrome b5 domain-containing protein [Candidatus Woesearchaeota archaeon]
MKAKKYILGLLLLATVIMYGCGQPETNNVILEEQDDANVLVEEQPEEQLSIITREELAQHSTQTDCWIGYQGVVYDVTDFLPRHPGSAQAIAPYCGTVDGFEQAFSRQHGPSQEQTLVNEGITVGVLE